MIKLVLDNTNHPAYHDALKHCSDTVESTIVAVWLVEYAISSNQSDKAGTGFAGY